MAANANKKIAKVMTGEAGLDTLSVSQQKQAFDKMVKANSRMAKMTDTLKENTESTATALIGGVEMTSAAFAASMMEGYFGSDAITVGGVDSRAILGLGSVAYGTFDLLTNKGKGGGAHAVNLGAGVLSSYLSSVGIQAGQALKANGIGGLTANKTVQAPKVAGNVGYSETEVVPGTTLMTEPAAPEQPAPGKVSQFVEHNQNRRNNRRRTIVQAANHR